MTIIKLIILAIVSLLLIYSVFNEEEKSLNSNVELSKNIPLIKASIPSSKYYLSPKVKTEHETKLTLVKLSEKKSKYNSSQNWWARNSLTFLEYKVPRTLKDEKHNLPAFIPKEFKGLNIVKAIKGNPTLAIYGKNFSEGRYLLAFNPKNKEKLFSFDFNSYTMPSSFKKEERDFISMAIRWAQVEGNTLYVSHSHRTYASSSNGYNAYITAIDIPSNTILWRSKPLISNSKNFIIKDDAIITAYGFSKEKDYIFVLNKSNGKVAQKIEVKSAARDLVEKENKVYVNSYNTEYIFKYENK